ncbi:MAG: hypothetical protein J5794_08200 [Lachnospiraceae bacterium]|nr:hypothetical protein [Lachnospiraceae bacterium]
MNQVSDRGTSQVKSFRIVTGILFLLGLVWFWVNPFKGPMEWVISRGPAYYSKLLGFLPYSLVFFFLPGLLSLILCRPTRAKSIVLTVLFCLLTSLDFVDKFLWILTWGALGKSTVLEYVLGRSFGINMEMSSLNPLLSICLLWSFVSIFQPKKLVGSPNPVLARPWKILSGIFHLSGGGLVLLGGFIGLIAIAATAPDDGLELAMALILMTSPVFFMIFSGILSISTGARSRQNELSSATAQFLTAVTSIETLVLLYFRFDIGAALNGNGASVFHLVIWFFFGIIILWYLIGAFIQFVTMLASRPAEA